MTEPATILVVDDDAAVRAALGMLLQSAGLACRSFAGAPEFLQAEAWKPGSCLIVDVRMPVMSGIELLIELRQRGVRIPVIVMTGHGDVPMAVTAMKHGAHDFIEKPFDDHHLLQLIAAATRAGAATLSREAERAAAGKRIASLTPREREVFALVAAGRLNKVIAYDLGLSTRTVEIHRARVMEKTGAGSLSDLVRIKVALEADP